MPGVAASTLKKKQMSIDYKVTVNDTFILIWIASVIYALMPGIEKIISYSS
jgi:hypothetical protein